MIPISVLILFGIIAIVFALIGCDQAGPYAVIATIFASVVVGSIVYRAREACILSYAIDKDFAHYDTKSGVLIWDNIEYCSYFYNKTEYCEKNSLVE